jgi:hypothetical protein
VRRFGEKIVVLRPASYFWYRHGQSATSSGSRSTGGSYTLREAFVSDDEAWRLVADAVDIYLI